MDINKIFAELGRMHLEIMQLKEQLAQALSQVEALTPKTPVAQSEQKSAEN